MDDVRPPSDVGLFAERAELPAQLGGEVLHPGQVGSHGLELAQGLFLAFAVFENPCRLFDEAPPVLWGRGENRVQLALPDNDMHLAADPRVGEQLLNVEQATHSAVDRVFGPAAGEHGPRQRHLGVLDGQNAVGVVDREQDLGAAQGRPTGRSGEDDIVHPTAAQALCALFAHHPGQRVDHI